METKKVAAYLRVSSEEQAKEGFSLENQEARIRAYCLYSNLGLPLILSEDKGVSGKRQSNRKAFQQMLEMARTNQLSNIVIYSLSRLGRNTIETLQFIDEMNTLGVAVHSLSEKLDTGSAMGKFITTIISAVCELESGQLGERVSSVLQNKKASQKQYCKKLTGFDNVEGNLVPNKDMAIVKMIFAMNTRGSTDAQIARFLTRSGFTTVNNKPFRHSGVRKILNNKIYTPFL